MADVLLFHINDFCLFPLCTVNCAEFRVTKGHIRKCMCKGERLSHVVVKNSQPWSSVLLSYWILNLIFYTKDLSMLSCKAGEKAVTVVVVIGFQFQPLFSFQLCTMDKWSVAPHSFSWKISRKRIWSNVSATNQTNTVSELTFIDLIYWDWRIELFSVLKGNVSMFQPGLYSSMLLCVWMTNAESEHYSLTAAKLVAT